jgi:DNA repair ATPase RecN
MLQGMSGELTNAQQAIEQLKASEDQIVRDLGQLAEQLTAVRHKWCATERMPPSSFGWSKNE